MGNLPTSTRQLSTVNKLTGKHISPEITIQTIIICHILAANPRVAKCCQIKMDNG